MQHHTQTASKEFSWKDFVIAIYKSEPQDPHTFSMEALEDMPKDALQKYLAHFIIYGAKTLYNKELAQLLPNEIAHLRRYLLSVGWKVDFKVETRQQKLNDADDKKETSVNYFMIDFIPAKRDELNDPNKPDRFA
jgi:hypothetical protein